MSSRFWCSFVLTALLALVLVASGAATPTPVAGNATNTRAAGIDVDATTIPQLEALMNAHRLNAVDLTNFFLRRINQLNPTLNAVITLTFEQARGAPQWSAFARAAHHIAPSIDVHWEWRASTRLDSAWGRVLKHAAFRASSG